MPEFSLDDEMIVACLRDENTPISSNMLRSLCSLVLMAAWDRKVEREFFAELVDDVARMSVDIADIETLSNMRALVSAQRGNVNPIDKEVHKLIVGFSAKRQKVADKMDLIAQCPGKNDSIS